MLLNAIGEKVRDLLFLPASEPIVIGRAQQHHIVVAGEHPPASKLPELQLSFPLQSLGDFLGYDLSAEHTRKAITDHAFEAALEALHEAHSNPLHAYDSSAYRIWVNGPIHRPVPNQPYPVRKSLFNAC